MTGNPAPGVRARSASVFAVGADVLVNPVNCRGTLGAGLARAFRDALPPAYAEAYRTACGIGNLRPGHVHVWRHPAKDLTVASLATKDGWRDPSRLEWIDAGLARLARWIRDTRPRHVALPALGCGLGGLRLADVRPLVDHHLANVPAQVTLCLPPTPGGQPAQQPRT